MMQQTSYTRMRHRKLGGFISYDAHPVTQYRASIMPRLITTHERHSRVLTSEPGEFRALGVKMRNPGNS